MQTYKYAIFDMDGTLLDSLADLKNAVNHVCAKYNHPTFSLEEIRKMVGRGNRKLMIDAIPQGEDDPNFEEKFQEFKDYYFTHCKEETLPYDGVDELLSFLKGRGIPTAIVSNKYDAAVKELAEYYFGDKITKAYGVKEGRKTKPSPDGCFEAMKDLGATKAETLYIGDSDVDAETAKNSELDCVLVSWGFRSRELLEKKQHIDIVDKVLDLEKFF